MNDTTSTRPKPRRRATWSGRLLTLLGLFVLAGAASAQGDPRVSVQLSSGVARLGQDIELQIVVEDASKARVTSLPRVEGLRFGNIPRPSNERGMSMANGRTTQWSRLRWRIPVRATAEGDYDVPPVVLEIDGREVRSRRLSLRVVRDLVGEDLGFLELSASPARVVEGQPFSIEVLFGWDQESRVNLADLLLPWWGDLPGAVELETAGLTQSAQKVEGVTVNGNVQVVVEEIRPVTRNGRRYRTFRLVQSFVPGRAGTLDFPTSYLEFGELVQARSLFDRPSKKTYFVEAPPLSLDVIALPAEGQPFDFSGAVGSFDVRANADSRDLVEGDSVKLEVVWSGSGNLEFFEPPDLSRLDAFRAFRIYGRTEEKSFERRSVTYDLAPLTPDVTSIPSVPLSVFDPESERYTTVATEPIPIRVRPLEGRVLLEADAGPRFVRDIEDIDTRPLALSRTTEASGPSDGLLVCLAFAVPALWLVLRAWVRKRHGDPDAPLERRRRHAARRLGRTLARANGPQEKLAALTSFLAAEAKEADEAWVGRDPHRWLAQHGVRVPERGRMAELLGRLEASVYGSERQDVPNAEILEAAKEWQRAAKEALAA